MEGIYVGIFGLFGTRRRVGCSEIEGVGFGVVIICFSFGGGVYGGCVLVMD
jgi:hypothetical protein